VAPAENAQAPADSDCLPERFRRFFWEADADGLTWGRRRDYITLRLLGAGDWEAVRWVRERLGDAELRRFLRRRRGRGLSPQQLRYWELAVDLTHEEVTAWIEAARAGAWERRAPR
jgi:hypothetical protein